MRNALTYEVSLFWMDETLVESLEGSYVAEQLKNFLVQKTVDKVKELPIAIQQEVLDRLIKSEL